MRVLVTGAASGIGRATCLRLARDTGAPGKKAQVAAVDIPTAASGLDSLANELKGLGAEVLPLHGDMADPEAPARAVGGHLRLLALRVGVPRQSQARRPPDAARRSRHQHAHVSPMLPRTTRDVSSRVRWRA